MNSNGNEYTLALGYANSPKIDPTNTIMLLSRIKQSRYLDAECTPKSEF